MTDHEHFHDKKEDHVVEQVDAAPAAPVVATVDHEIPDGGYGWIIVLCVFTINFCTWGNATSFGVYLAYYLAQDSIVGATPLDYALIGGLQFGVSMLLAPVVTPTCRMLNLRPTMRIGVFIHALGYIFAGFAGNRLWVLFITQGVMIGVGLSFIFVPAAAVLPQYFWKKRTLAVSIGSAGAGLGGMVFSLATDPMIRNLGVGWALRITGIICFVCEMCVTFFMKDRNATIKPTQHGFAVYLLKRKNVIMLLSHSFLVMLGYISVVYSMSSYARALGVGDKNASLATALLNLGTFIGRPLVGLCSDKYGRLKVAFICTLSSAVLVFAIWIPTNSLGVLIFLALLIGAICGSFWSTIAPLAAEVVGVQDIPSMLSLCWLSVVLPTSFAEAVALYLRRSPTSSKPYIYVQVFSGLAYVVSSLFLLELLRMKKNAERKLKSGD